MNKKLYIGNLPFSAEEGQLQALFGADGRQVVSVRILNDRLEISVKWNFLACLIAGRRLMEL